MKATVSEKYHTIAINDEDNPSKEINENLKELREKEPSLVPENVTAENFATMDDAVIIDHQHSLTKTFCKKLHRLKKRWSGRDRE